MSRGSPVTKESFQSGTRIAVAIGFAIVLGIIAGLARAGSPASITPELELGSTLDESTLSEVTEKTTLVGDVDRAQWTIKSDDERRLFAHQLQRKLEARMVSEAIIFDGDAIAIEISDGEVRGVQ